MIPHSPKLHCTICPTPLTDNFIWTKLHCKIFHRNSHAVCESSYCSHYKFIIIMDHGRRDGRHRKHSSRKQDRKAQGDDDNSSLSSLGSLPEATSVVLQFNDDLPSQRRLTTHLGNAGSHTSSHSHSHSHSHSQTLSRLKDSRSRVSAASSSAHHSSSSSSKTCPHCNKSFANAFAVPKHIAVCSNLTI